MTRDPHSEKEPGSIDANSRWDRLERINSSMPSITVGQLRVMFLAAILVMSMPLTFSGGFGVIDGDHDGTVLAEEHLSESYNDGFSNGSLNDYIIVEDHAEEDEFGNTPNSSTDYYIDEEEYLTDGGSLYLEAVENSSVTNPTKVNATYDEELLVDGDFQLDLDAQFDVGSGENMHSNGFFVRLENESGENIHIEYDATDSVNWAVSGSLVNGATEDVGPLDSDGHTRPWTNIRLEFDNESETAELYVDDEVAINTSTNGAFDQSRPVELTYEVQTQGGSGDSLPAYYSAWIDRASLYNSIGEPVSGRVTDQNGDPIDGATVTFRNVSTDSETTTQTGSDGSFTTAVESGRYELSISADGYQTLTDTRDVEGGDELGTFQLSPQQFDLQFKRFVEPGESTPYTVEYTDPNGTVVDVTANVSINSSNTSIATIDTDAEEIVGEDGVNGTSEITANYTVNNETYTDTRTVTVATKTVDNLEIIPGTWRFSAFLDDITIQVLLVAIGAAIVATRAASSWAGLGAMELVLIIGWFADWVPIGIAMLGLFTALFIGLNLAANIDYSVRR